MQDLFYPSKDGKTTIHACMWKPDGDIKGIVQIVHGMAEYAERYAPFAEFLVENGYLVCAEDHLGHGKSVVSEEYLGYFTAGNGVETVLADIRSLTELIKGKHPDLPYFILGHSMGSFFTRKYLTLYGGEMSGAVIMGTGYMPAIATSAGRGVTGLIALFRGWKHRSKAVDKMAFGSYNKRFPEHRTPYDWLSRNPENVDNYIADELCGVTFTCSGFYGLFSIVKAACKNKAVKAVPKNLPVYLVSGSDDPVGGYSKGVKKLYDKLVKYGVEDVSMTLYADSRHEILNDYCAPQVREDILEFFDGVLKNAE